MTTTSADIASTVRISFLRILGQGGFGKVFLAEMATGYGFTQRIAVKVLHPEYQQEPKLLSRLLDEARMLGALNHRNIVKVYDVCEVNGQSAILMEYVEGRSLSTLLKEGPLTWGQTWQVIADCALALSDAYNAKHQVTGNPLYLMHRDIKPSNLLLSSSGTVKLLDFGIAKMNGVGESKTSTHQMGTARYMAPEQWLANQSSPSVDVYALARTALELLNGEFLPRTPLDRALHDQVLLKAVRHAPSADVPQILADAGRELLWRMLSYDSEQRPSITEVADRALGLAEAIGGESLRGLIGNRSQRGPILGDASVTETVPFDLSAVDTESLLTLVQGDQQTESNLNMSKFDSSQTNTVSGVSIGIGMGAVLCLGGALWTTQQEPSTESNDTEPLAKRVVERPLHSSSTEQELLSSDNQDAAPVLKQSSKSKPTVINEQPKPVYSVVISSLPLGAMVFIDGKASGRTLLHNVPLKEGTHHLELHFGEVHIERTVDITGDTRFVWRPNASSGTEEWSSFSP